MSAEEHIGVSSLLDAELRYYSRGRAIAAVALPAIVQNAAGPLTAAVQTALLGRYASTAALAAFAAVSISAGFFTKLFTFLVDGVSAKVGKSAGTASWGELKARVQLALAWALGAGAVASLLLAALKVPVLEHVLSLSADVLREVGGYWWLRCGLVPILLFNMSITGVLQGFHRVQISALLNSAQALLELGGSAAVLVWGVPVLGAQGLLAMGLVTAATQLLLSVAGFLCVLLLPVRGASGGHFRLLDVWLPAVQQRWRLWRLLPGGQQQPAAPGAASGVGADLEEPLLGEASSAHGRAAPGKGLAAGAAGIGGAEEAAWDAMQHPHDEEQASREQASREHTLDFLRAGLDMLVRSMVMQTIVFASLVAASRLGTASLAAHSIIGQLWILISYVVDGFAAAGIVLGSRLAAYAHDPLLAGLAREQFQRLITRVSGAGLLSGILAMLLFAGARQQLAALFTNDPATLRVLGQGSWLVMVLVQPVNGLVFVYDGLMYASQSFTYIRNMMLLGLGLVFAPLLGLELLHLHALWGVWLANAAVNVWRLGGAAWLIHWRFLQEFGECEVAS